MPSKDEIAVRVRLKERLRFARDAKATKDDIDDIGKAGDRSSGGLRKFNVNMAAANNVMSLVKVPAIITGVGLLTQMLSAATAGAVAFTSGMTPAVGLLATMPSIGGAAAAGLLVTTLALQGVGEALGGLNEHVDPKKLALLTPAARSLVLEIDKLKPSIIGAQQAAQDGLFPGLTDALGVLSPMLKNINPWLTTVGEGVGDLARRGAGFADRFKGDIGDLGSDTVPILRNLGTVGFNLSGALLQIMVAARPLTDWLVKGLALWSQNVFAWSEAGRESGKLAGFFDKTKESLQLLGGILGPFGRALGNILGAGYEEGSNLLTVLGDNARKFEEWTASIEGKKSITQWFTEAMPAVYEIGRLIRDVTADFFKLGQGDQVAPLLATLRTDLLPQIMELIDLTTKNFGPVLVPAIVSVLEVLTDLAGTNGPLTMLVGAIGGVAGALHDLLKDHDNMKSMVSWTIGFVGLLGLMGGMATISGIIGLGRGFAILGTAVAWFGTTTAGTAIGVGALTIAEWAMTAATTALAIATQILLSPITLIVLAIALLAAGLVYAYLKVGWFHDAVNAIFNFIKNNWQYLIGIIALPFAPLIIAITAAIRHKDDLIDGFNSFIGFMGSLPGKLAGAGKGMFNFIIEAYRHAINFVIGGWNSLEFKIPGFDPPGPGPKFGGFTLGVPDIPMLAAGGDISHSGSVIVGDAGPEILTLPRGARVTPLKSPRYGEHDPIDLGSSGMRNLFAQLVMPDGRVLAEIVADVVEDDKARR